MTGQLLASHGWLASQHQSSGYHHIWHMSRRMPDSMPLHASEHLVKLLAQQVC